MCIILYNLYNTYIIANVTLLTLYYMTLVYVAIAIGQAICHVMLVHKFSVWEPDRMSGSTSSSSCACKTSTLAGELNVEHVERGQKQIVSESVITGAEWSEICDGSTAAWFNLCHLVPNGRVISRSWSNSRLLVRARADQHYLSSLSQRWIWVIYFFGNLFVGQSCSDQMRSACFDLTWSAWIVAHGLR